MNGDDKRSIVTKIYAKVIEDLMKGPDRPAPKTARRELLFSAGLPWTRDESARRKANCERLGREAVHLVIRPGAPTIVEFITLEMGRARSSSFLWIVSLDDGRLGLAEESGRWVTTLRNGQLRRDSCWLDIEAASERGSEIVEALFEKHAKAACEDDLLLVNEIGLRSGFASRLIGSMESPNAASRLLEGHVLLRTTLSGATVLLYRDVPEAFNEQKATVSGGQLLTMDTMEILNADAKPGETRLWLDFGDDIAAGPISATFIETTETGAHVIVGCRLWMAAPDAPLLLTQEDPHGPKAHYRLVDGQLKRFPGQPAPDLAEGHALAIAALSAASHDVFHLSRPEMAPLIEAVRARRKLI